MGNDFEIFLEKYAEIKNFKGQNLKDVYYKGFNLWFESYQKGEKDYIENLSGMTANGLTKEEAFYILAYTGSFSSWINSDLRNSHLPECECKSELINRLNMSLCKVINFSNSIVYRMDAPLGEKEKILKWFNSKIGCIFKLPYFLSSAKEDYKNSEIVWRIKTLNTDSLGKDISNITNNKYEQEVLFQTGSCFKIEGVDKDTEYIELTEVDAKSDVDFELTKSYWSNI